MSAQLWVGDGLRDLGPHTSELQYLADCWIGGEAHGSHLLPTIK